MDITHEDVGTISEVSTEYSVFFIGDLCGTKMNSSYKELNIKELIDITNFVKRK